MTSNLQMIEHRKCVKIMLSQLMITLFYTFPVCASSADYSYTIHAHVGAHNETD